MLKKGIVQNHAAMWLLWADARRFYNHKTDVLNNTNLDGRSKEESCRNNTFSMMQIYSVWCFSIVARFITQHTLLVLLKGKWHSCSLNPYFSLTSSLLSSVLMWSFSVHFFTWLSTPLQLKVPSVCCIVRYTMLQIVFYINGDIKQEHHLLVSIR